MSADRSSEKKTAALIEAVTAGDAKQVDALLATGADANGHDDRGLTPLMHAARSTDNPKIVKRLLAAGADPALTDDHGWTALRYAQRREPSKTQKAVVELLGPGTKEVTKAAEESGLVRNPAGVFLRNIGGRLADNISWWFVGIWQIWLTWLLLGTQVSLLCYVVTVNVSWLAGLAIALPIVAILTTLAIAVSRRYSRREKRNAVAVLADSEDEPTDADPTPLMAAIDRGAGPTEISALIAGGADVNQRNRYGMTALMWAAFDAGPDVTRTLLAAGAKVDLADEDGDTALMNAAAFNDHFEVIEMLLEAGADASTRNNDGQTALDHAKMNPDSAAEKRIVKLLRAAEASTKKKR